MGVVAHFAEHPTTLQNSAAWDPPRDDNLQALRLPSTLRGREQRQCNSPVRAALHGEIIRSVHLLMVQGHRGGLHLLGAMLVNETGAVPPFPCGAGLDLEVKMVLPKHHSRP